MGKYVCTYCKEVFERQVSKTVGSKNLFCSKKCQGMFLSIPAHDRAWPKVDKRGPDECWPWTGSKYNGYGYIANRYGSGLATRVIVETVLQEPLPDWLHVCHKCDNPPCCNPAHLFLGTDADNTADKVAKGRHCRHEKRPKAKLTMEKARQIRVATGSLREIAKAFGVGQTVIWNVRHGHSWKEDACNSG